VVVATGSLLGGAAEPVVVDTGSLLLDGELATEDSPLLHAPMNRRHGMTRARRFIWLSPMK